MKKLKEQLVEVTDLKFIKNKEGKILIVDLGYICKEGEVFDNHCR